MNISYNWLKDYVNFDLTPQELSAALTSIGLETGSVEEVETIKGGLQGLVTGHVLTCVDHPDSDHLHVTTVNLGGDEPQQIVCGAPNVAAGQKVIVATIGTKLYSGNETFTIKKSKIRGVESNGMICAEDEIGLGTDHAGIIVLPADAPAGMPAGDYYKVKSDYILEVDITPNRVDAASHYGVARDLAAYLQKNGKQVELKKPSIDAFKIEDKSPAVEVAVKNTEACPRYSGITIKNVKVAESPGWLKDRLQAIGLRPINNVVDITNYVLHEFGQPLHAFDRKEITGDKVLVMTLPEGTGFTTLDEVERTLSDRDLMICNDHEGMCIGGVFGGLKSGVTGSTADVFLESAYFHPTWIRKTARRHGLSTDASFRFERGCDPNNTIYVLKRAALMIKEIAGGTISGELQDIYPNPIENAIVDVSYQKINRVIGKEIPSATVKNILKFLEIEIIGEHDNILTLSIPTYRVDVQHDVDVIEEILRIYGFNNVEIGDNLKSNLSYLTPTDEAYKLQNLISEQLTGAGFHEIMNNSLTSRNYYDGLETYPENKCVKLTNPLSAELDVMRQTLLYGGLESIAYNRNRKNPDLSFYEFGNVYSFHSDKFKEESPLTAIKEESHLALWLTGNKVSNNWNHPDEKSSIYELKAYVENILLRLGINRKKVSFKPYTNELFLTALSVETVSGRELGVLGILSKKCCKKFDINAEVYYSELSWNNLMKEAGSNKITASEISRFPPAKRDLALLLDQKVLFSEIEKIAFDTDRKLLKEVALFDVYEGKNLPEGKKSYAVSFILQDEEKTLNDKQIDNLMNRIQMNLKQKLNAQLR
ncbi:MAG: phenylalanine--tRNA ligase subunit beta [Dysgonamonadaceae bacterium]|jgi:phenylalanyl-tRNA synthetase beta chain|nr:phenylalanine--tRNA ligase subunit beta [Dysgonamonadaceae bacterium]